jgi:hypothetical protein
MTTFSDEKFYIILILWYIFSVTGLSYFGGWYALAQHYRQQNPRLGNRLNTIHFSSVRISILGNYHSTVQIGIHEKGIRLSQGWILRWFHPPIHLRWDHIVQAEWHQGLLGDYVLVMTDANLTLKIFGNIKDSLFASYESYTTRGETAA